MKKRYVILDALRGIAGLCVPLLHFSESFTAPHCGAAARMQVCGHGYLAVEFFMLLMGYMLGFAYDRRWREGMSSLDFAWRRLRRLHPFVLTGLAIAFVQYLAQLAGAPVLFPWFRDSSAGEMAWYLLAGACVFPAIGCSVIAPFNACTWTLYYEYLGNILYGAFLRRLGRGVLLVLSVLAGLLTICYVMRLDPGALFGVKTMAFAFGGCYTIAGGWGMQAPHVWSGMVRLLFPLFFGLFLFRTGWKIRLSERVAAPLAVIAFLIVLFMPYSYGTEGCPLPLWANGVYELAVVIVVLPLLLLIGVGAGTSVAESRWARVAVFFGELSYPLYMTHYPFYEIHSWWLRNHSGGLSPVACFLVTAGEYLFCLVASWCVMRLVDRLTRPAATR